MEQRRDGQVNPPVFTKQGMTMLFGFLRSGAMVCTGIGMVQALIELKRFFMDYGQLFEKVGILERQQIKLQNSIQEQLEQFSYRLAEQRPLRQKVFFAGQSYDAFRLLTSLISMAESELILVDSYVDVNTLDVLAKKKRGVCAKIYTRPYSSLTKRDILEFNRQYPILQVIRTEAFHDRFLIMDGHMAYHIGASVKDAGKRCFGINKIEDEGILSALLDRLKESVS